MKDEKMKRKKVKKLCLIKYLKKATEAPSLNFEEAVFLTTN